MNYINLTKRGNTLKKNLQFRIIRQSSCRYWILFHIMFSLCPEAALSYFLINREQSAREAEQKNLLPQNRHFILVFYLYLKKFSAPRPLYIKKKKNLKQTCRCIIINQAIVIVQK